MIIIPMDIRFVWQNNFSKLQKNFIRNKDIIHETLSGETNTLAELDGKHFPGFPYFDDAKCACFCLLAISIENSIHRTDFIKNKIKSKTTNILMANDFKIRRIILIIIYRFKKLTISPDLKKLSKNRNYELKFCRCKF